MPGYEQIEWFPLCAGLTALGLIATWFAWRKRGAASGLRLAAWSLLPLAAYLTGLITVVWKTGTAIASWAVNLAIRPSMWAGVALAGLAIVAFVVSGVLKRRGSQRAARSQATETQGAAADQSLQGRGGSAGSPQEIAATSGKTPATSGKTKTPAGSGAGAAAGGKGSASEGDEDFSDVEEILRRHGIS